MVDSSVLVTVKMTIVEDGEEGRMIRGSIFTSAPLTSFGNAFYTCMLSMLFITIWKGFRFRYFIR